MSQYREIIAEFATKMAVIIAVEEEFEHKEVVILRTAKYCIHIYPKGISRIESQFDLPIIHIDIDEVITSGDKILKRIKGLHGQGERIYARQTVVARVDKRVCLDFQNEHHLQTAMPGKYRYGLFYKGELVSVAVFSGGRLMRSEGEGYRSFELIRFCHKGDLLVVGGLSKLLKSFVKDFNPQDIMTYADLDWTQDSSLNTIGFNVISQTDSQEFYVVDGIRKSKLDEHDLEYYKVKNSGSLKLKLIL